MPPRAALHRNRNRFGHLNIRTRNGTAANVLLLSSHDPSPSPLLPTPPNQVFLAAISKVRVVPAPIKSFCRGFPWVCGNARVCVLNPCCWCPTYVSFFGAFSNTTASLTFVNVAKNCPSLAGPPAISERLYTVSLLSLHCLVECRQGRRDPCPVPFPDMLTRSSRP